MSTHIVRYCRLLAVAVALSPWATAFGADAFPRLCGGAASPDSTDGTFTAVATDSSSDQCKLTAYSPCVPESGPCPPGQGTSGAGLPGSSSGGLGGSTSGGLGGSVLGGATESSTSPNASLLGGEQIGGTGGGEVAVTDSPGGYIDNAIIGNVVRFRTDLAFNDENPDMAEFIYAECHCVDPQHARGPGTTSPLTPINYQELSTYIELSYSDRLSAFAEVPLRFIQFTGAGDSGFNNGGFGDLNVGFKFAVIHNPDQYLTAQFRAYVPTGNPYQGLGTGHLSLEPALLWWHRLGDRLCVQAEIRDWIPIDGDQYMGSNFAGNVIRYGFGAGYDLLTPCCSRSCCGCSNLKVTAVTEVVGWEVLGGLYTANGITGPAGVDDATGTSIVNLKIGTRLTWGQNSQNTLFAGWGHALTEQAWYRDIARVEIARSF